MIEEIKEALEKATQGKWDGDGGRFIEAYNVEGEFVSTIASTYGDNNIVNPNHEADAHLIGNAPKWIRYLLDELEKANIALYTHESYDRTVSELHEENEKLRAEHTAMKHYLMELRAETSHDHIASQISNVLSTLSKEESHE